MVSFTGSTAAGARGEWRATASPVVLELGGKSAFIIFDDFTRLRQRRRDTLEGAFFNKGEACTAASRILVQREFTTSSSSDLGQV